MKRTSPSVGSTDDTISLSTGETVALPVAAEVTITGVVFGVSLEEMHQLLSDDFSPIHATPQQATITVLCAEYHRIGSQGTIEPYNECMILFPAIPESADRLPYRSAFTRHVGGYVWYQAVTTESAKALNSKVWGYPTAVGEITHTDTGSSRRTTVTVDDDHLLTVELECPPPIDQIDFATRYTVTDGILCNARIEFGSGFGIWPAHNRLHYTLGTHPLAERLRDFMFSAQAVFRFAGTGDVTLYVGQSVGSHALSSRSQNRNHGRFL